MVVSQCLDWDWFPNSESIGASIFFVVSLLHRCLELLERTKGLAQDDACHFKKSLQCKLAELRKALGPGQSDTPAMQLYAKILELVIVVDQFHFRNHSNDDDYCLTQTNPLLHEELLKYENSQSSEQLFRLCITTPPPANPC